MSDDQTLLERHRPKLIMLAQNNSLHRPWKNFIEFNIPERGDYHPCSAEFFLSWVFQRDRPRSYWAGVFGDPPHPPPTGLDALKTLAAETTSEATLDWEMDIAPIESQDAMEAWQVYAMMKAQQEFTPTVYGRVIRSQDGIALMYWFLYAYNDAPNKHEGDWEMVAIELDASETPVQAGYASHKSGLRRAWADIEKATDDPQRPVVYVARGSHAAYFHHKPGGHRTNSAVVPKKNLPFPIEMAMELGVRALQNAIIVLRLEDQTPRRPPDDGASPAPPTADDPESVNGSEWVDPALVCLPEVETVTADSRYWWMRLRGPWGSRHTRLLGDTAPDPPWEQGKKWNETLAWIRSLDWTLRPSSRPRRRSGQ